MRALTLVFDLDGTLVHTAPDLMATLNMILAREGAAPLPLEQANALIGGGARVLLERGFAANGRTIDEGHMAELYRDFLDHYAEHLAEHSRPYDGVEAALARFRAEGHVLAVCTNKVTWHSRKLVEELGLAGSFKAVCGGDAFAWRKPDARHLTMTIAEAGGDPARAVMVGDSITDVSAARNAGIPVICVDFGYTDVPARELGADAVVSHFSELDHTIRAIAARFGA